MMHPVDMRHTDAQSSLKI